MPMHRIDMKRAFLKHPGTQEFILLKETAAEFTNPDSSTSRLWSVCQHNDEMAVDSYHDLLKQFGQVRPTCSEECGKWVKAYPKKKKKKKKQEEEEDDKPDPMEFSVFNLLKV